MLFIYGIRTSIFAVAWCAMIANWIVIFAVVMFIELFVKKFISFRVFYATMLSVGAWLTIFGMRLICGVHWTEQNKMNIPQTGCVVIANHQTVWETVYMTTLFDLYTFVLKQEILHIPFLVFYYALYRLRLIEHKKRSLQQLLKQGCTKLKENYFVIIYPEGTRRHWSQLGPYHNSAAMLAMKANVPVLPMVHNSGRVSEGWIKKPGKITVCFGPTIPVHERSLSEIMDDVNKWTKENYMRINSETDAKKKDNVD